LVAKDGTLGELRHSFVWLAGFLSREARMMGLCRRGSYGSGARVAVGLM
jgi:hypothetical protein